MRLSREIARLFRPRPSGRRKTASSKAIPLGCNACDEEREQHHDRGCGGFVIVNAVPRHGQIGKLLITSDIAGHGVGGSRMAIVPLRFNERRAFEVLSLIFMNKVCGSVW